MDDAERAWRTVATLGQADNDSVLIYSQQGPGHSMSLMHVWFESDFTIHKMSLYTPAAMTPTALRRFPWDRWLYSAEVFQRGLMEDRRRVEGPARPAVSSDLGPKVPKRPGRRGHPDAHYISVAKRYRELVASGVRNPTSTIAAERFVSHNTVSGWLKEARRRGYLSPSRRGRAG